MCFSNVLLSDTEMRINGKTICTSGFVELQGNMRIETQAEVVVEDINRKLHM